MDLISPAQLSVERLDIWDRLQASSTGHLSSPFCRPEWALHCHAVRPGVEVAVWDRDGQLAFFPFHRRRATGGPVAGVLTDWETLIAPAGWPWEESSLLRDCRLSAYRFWNWPAEAVCSRHSWECAESHHIDLSQGFEAYALSLRGSKRHKLRREIGRLKRRAEERHGPVSLRWLAFAGDGGREAPHVAALDQMLRWKHATLERRGWSDGLNAPWMAGLMRRILDRPAPQFSASIAALYFGDTLAAGELYLRSGPVAHAWLRAYRPECQPWGPGHLLFWEAAQELAEQGVQRIDWGRGDEPFKQKFASGQTPVLAGCLDRSPLRSLARASLYRAAIEGPARRWLRQARRLFYRPQAT